METSSQVGLKLSSVETSQVNSLFSRDFASGEYLETSPHVNSTQVIMFAPVREEDIVFGADPVCVGVAVSVACLKNYISGIFGWILTKLAWLHCQDGGKQSLGFDGLDLIFKSRRLDQKWRICSLSMKFGQTWFNISL